MSSQMLGTWEEPAAEGLSFDRDSVSFFFRDNILLRAGSPYPQNQSETTEVGLWSMSCNICTAYKYLL